MTGPGLDDLTQSLGDGGGLDPQMEAIKPARRRAIFLTVAGVVVLLLIVLVSIFRNRPTATPVGGKTASGDTVVAAPVATTPTTAQNDSQLVASDTTTSDGAERSLVDTSIFQPTPTAPGAATGDLTAPGALLPGAGQTPGTMTPGGEQLLTPPEAAAGGTTGVGGVTPGAGLPDFGGRSQDADSAAVERRAAAAARADSIRAAKAAAAARRDSLRLAAYLAREAKLRGGTMMLAIGEGSALDGVLVSGARAAGSSRFEDPGASGGSPSALAGGADATGENALSALPPGTQVSAITVAPYEQMMIGAMAGMGGQDGQVPVELRLTSAVRLNGRIVLPAGTRAYAQVALNQMMMGGGAMGQGGVVPYGQPLPLTMRVTTFVTPNGQVFRGVQATGINPVTKLAFTADVGRRPLQRVGRTLLQTGLEFVITANSQRFDTGVSVGGVPVVTTPSARDIAVLNAMTRSGDLVRGLLGDETTDPVTIKLPANLPVLLVFGF